MNREGCEAHKENEVNKLEGIIEVNTYYEVVKTTVKYDQNLTNPCI